MLAPAEPCLDLLSRDNLCYALICSVGYHYPLLSLDKLCKALIINANHW